MIQAPQAGIDGFLLIWLGMAGMAGMAVDKGRKLLLLAILVCDRDARRGVAGGGGGGLVL